MQTFINLFKQNNEHARIMRKVRFTSFFKPQTLLIQSLVLYIYVMVKESKN